MRAPVWSSTESRRDDEVGVVGVEVVRVDAVCSSVNGTRLADSFFALFLTLVVVTGLLGTVLEVLVLVLVLVVLGLCLFVFLCFRFRMPDKR